jgi:two-component system, LuxR family, sensor kinase FixL
VFHVPGAQLRREDVVVFSRPDDLPAAAAHDVASYRRYGVRSALIVPVVAGPRVLAALSLVIASTERTWPEGIVQWLRLVAETFASALARKEAEEALRASEQSKSAILASLSSAVAVLDRDGRIVDVNARWRRAERPPVMCGVGENLLDGFARSPSVDAGAAVPGILGVLRGERSEFALEYRCQTSAGEPWYLVTAVPLEGVDGGAVVSCTDITERKRAELDAERSRHEMAHFTRVSTLAQLAVSLAHEMNQPLTGILVNARAGLRLLEGAPPDIDEVKEILRDVVDDDKRASEVIQRLRDLLRKGEPERVALDINVVVSDVVRLLAADAIIRNVTVTLELSPREVLVAGDRVELQQVVLDLVLNAMDAVAEGAGSARTIVVKTEAASGTVHVVVRDTGTGLRPGSLDLIFEPLFTTKPKRLGMGLAIARSIVESHGGAISAADHPAGGAVVHVALPAASPDSV